MKKEPTFSGFDSILSVLANSETVSIVLIICCFIYFMATLIFNFFEQKKTDKCIDRNSDLLDKVTQALTLFNENIKSLNK